MPHPNPQTDAAEPLAPLVRAAAAGDDQAWEALVRRLTPAIRGTARTYRLSPCEVDDVVQSCWLKLLLNVRSLREPEAVGAWLVTTARRQALRVCRGDTRELLSDAPLPADLATPDSPENAAIAAELTRELRAAVRRLPGRQRELIETMVDEPDRSYAEVSVRLGMPVGSIGPTRERGLRRLAGDRRLLQLVGA